MCTCGVLRSSLVDRTSSYNDDMLTSWKELTCTQKIGEKRESTTARLVMWWLFVVFVPPTLFFHSFYFLVSSFSIEVYQVFWLSYFVDISMHEAVVAVYIYIFVWVSEYLCTIVHYLDCSWKYCCVSCVSISGLSTWLYFMIRLYVAESDCFLALR